MKIFLTSLLAWMALFSAGQNSLSANSPRLDTLAPFELSDFVNNVEQMEYHVSFDQMSQTYQSPNRKQGLRSRYLNNAWKIESRNPNQEGAISAAIVFNGIESENALLIDQKEPDVELDENTIRQVYQNYHIEYFNTTEGIKQNLIIEHPITTGDQLRFQFEVKGLDAIVQEQTIEFYNQQGEIQLLYNGLAAFDATGRQLDCHLHAKDKNKWEISVNQQHAVYPITLDPTIQNVSNAWSILTMSDTTSSGFGLAMNNRIEHNYWIIGAPYFDRGQYNEGVVFSADRVWLESNKKDALFGSSITFSSLGRDTIMESVDLIVGARGYSNGQLNEGAVYIYYGSIGWWGVTIYSGLRDILESNVAGAGFGSFVMGAGDLNGDGFEDLGVGAPNYSNGQNSEGAVWVIYGDSSGADTNSMLILESNQSEAKFGSVLASGDFQRDGWSDLVIGAPYFENGQIQEGVAFIYSGSSKGIDSASYSLLESNNPKAKFGFDLANVGDVNGDGFEDLLIGSPDFSYRKNNYWTGNMYWASDGAAILCYGDPNGLSNTRRDTIVQHKFGWKYGFEVEPLGDLNNDGFADFGIGQKATSYPWKQIDQFTIHFGSSQGWDTTAYSVINQANLLNVQKQGEYLLVASTSVPPQQENVVEVYRFNATGKIRNPHTEVFTGRYETNFKCKPIGDLNGDQVEDIVVSSTFSWDQYPQTDAVIHLGTPDGYLEQGNADHYWSEVLHLEYFKAGDINGDGWDDFLGNVGGLPTVGLSNGKGYGHPSLKIVQDGLQFFSNTWAVSPMAGDINGDGYDDVVLASKGLRLYAGDSIGLNTNYTNWIQEASKVYLDLEAVGDLNNDGYDDVLVLTDDTTTNEKQLILYWGDALGFAITKRKLIHEELKNEIVSVTLIGDVNSNGFVDIALGLRDSNKTQSVLILNGDSSGYYSSGKILRPDISSSSFGNSICYADVNRDGNTDVFIGSSDYGSQGEVFIYTSDSTGLGLYPSYKLVPQNGQDEYPWKFLHYGHEIYRVSDSSIIVNDDSVLTGFGYYVGNRGAANIFSFLTTDDHVRTSVASNETTIIGCDSVEYENVMYYTDTTIWLDQDSFEKLISLEYIHLKINHGITTYEELSACQEYRTADGRVFEESSVFETVYTGFNGCDSTVLTSLTILQPTQSLIQEQTCKSYLSPGGKLLIKSGVYSDTLVNAAGCDSIITIELIIGNRSEQYLTLAHCGPLTLANGKTFESSGSYIDSFISVYGCDSIITYDVEIHNLDKTIPAEFQMVKRGSDVQFSVITDPTAEGIQWQTNIGFGFDELYNAGQYDGVHTDTLRIYNVDFNNHRQVFRCIVSKGLCADTSAVTKLSVTDGASVEGVNPVIELKAFPNPTTSLVKIEGIDAKEVESVILVDLLGKAEQLEFTEDFELRINGSPGVYYLEVYLKNNNKTVIQIVKVGN